MNLTKHIMERYVERVKGIREPNAMKQYLAQNREQVTDSINKHIEHGTLIHTGAFNKKGDKDRNFLLSGDYVIVQATDNGSYITMYNCDYGYSDKTNRKIKNDLLEELEQAKQRYKETCGHIDEMLSDVNTEVKKLQVEISNLENELRNKEAILKKTKEYRETVQSRKQEALSETNRLIQMICRPIDFSADSDLIIG